MEVLAVVAALLATQLREAVHVQLPHERAVVVVAEVLRQRLVGELVHLVQRIAQRSAASHVTSPHNVARS
jgi:hypothetical protein